MGQGRTGPVFGDRNYALGGNARKIIVEGDIKNNGEARWKRIRQGAQIVRDMREVGWVSDVSTWSPFIDTIHDKFLDEAYTDHRHRSRGYKMSVINTAYTKFEDGTKFFYFDAVDRGRKAVVSASGKPIVFLHHNAQGKPGKLAKLKKGKTYGPPFQIYARKVKASQPAYITLKAKQLIDASFNHEIEKALTRFIKGLGKRFAAQFGETPQSLPKLEFTGYQQDLPPKGKRSRGAEKARRIEIANKGLESRTTARSKAAATAIKRKKKNEVVVSSEKPKGRLVKRDGSIIESSTPVTHKTSKRGEKDLFIKAQQAKEAGLSSFRKPTLKEKTFRVVPQVPLYLKEFADVISDKEIEEVSDEDATAYLRATIEKLSDVAERLEAEITSKMIANAKKYLYDDAIKQREKLKRELRDRNKHDAQRLEAALGGKIYFGRPKQGGVIQQARFAENLKDLDDDAKANALKNVKNFNDARTNIWIAMLRLDNPEELMKIFAAAIDKQVKHFQKVTPSRKGFKFLAFSNTYLEPNTPSKGSHADVLKNSYALASNRRMSDRLKRYGSAKK